MNGDRINIIVHKIMPFGSVYDCPGPADKHVYCRIIHPVVLFKIANIVLDYIRSYRRKKDITLTEGGEVSAVPFQKSSIIISLILFEFLYVFSGHRLKSERSISIRPIVEQFF